MKLLLNLSLSLSLKDKNDITAARTAALAGLPLYLKEDSSDIFKSCKVISYSPSPFIFHKLLLALSSNSFYKHFEAAYYSWLH